MRKTLGKLKQAISILLIAVMVITVLPQVSVPVLASEAQNVSDGNDGADTIQDAAGDDDADAAGPVDGTGSGDQEDPKKPEEEGGAGETGIGDDTETGQPGTGDGAEAGQPGTGDGTETDQPDEDGTQDDDGMDADETQDGDGTETGEQEPAEEPDADADETLKDAVEEADQMPVQAVTAGGNTDEGEEVKKIDVKVALPYYQGVRLWEPCLSEFSYAIGEDTKYTTVPMEDKNRYELSYDKHTYTHTISVEAGKSLRFKLACKENTRLKEVSWKSKEQGSDYGSSTAMEATDGVYTLAVEERPENGYWSIENYEIDINAVQFWKIKFVDMYARDHEGEPSVEVYRKKQNSEGETTSEDIVGQTITVDSEEWDSYYYTVKPKEDFTFDSMAASVSGVKISRAKDKKETNAYYLWQNGNTPRDITIFVMAEPSQQKTITLNMSAEVTNTMQVEAYGKAPSQTQYEKLEVTNGKVTVQDDMAVYVQVTSSDMSYMVQATYQETGGEPEPFAESDVDTSIGDSGWTREFTLGALNHITDGITVNLSRVSTRKVSMTVDWAAVHEIHVSTPFYGYVDEGFEEGEEQEITAYVPEKEVLKFYVAMETGKGAALVSAEDGTEIGIAGYDDDMLVPYYIVDPDSDMNISVKGREYEYRFAYSQEDVSILVYESEVDSGELLELTDNCYRSYDKEGSLWLRVKPKAGRGVSVWYDRGDGYREEVGHSENDDRTEEDGSRSLCYGPIDKEWAADQTVTIETYRENTVAFMTENNLSFDEWEYEPDSYSFYYKGSIDGPVTVREGEDLYFSVSGYKPNTHRLLIGMTGTDRDSLESRWHDKEMEDFLVYHLVPAADTTITFTLEERKECQVVIEKSDTVGSFIAWYDDDGMGIDNLGTYNVREDGYVTVAQITPAGSAAEAAAKRGKVVYQIGQETYEAELEYDWGMGEPIYRIKVTDDMKIMIDVQDIVRYTISFKDDSAQLENIRVWKHGTDEEKANLYHADTGTATVDDSGYYYADFQLKDGVGLGSVTLKDSVGSEKVLARTYLEEYEEMGYRIGMLRGNTEIIPELVSGYTVKFDLSKLSAEDTAKTAIYDSVNEKELIVGQKDSQDSGSRKISAAVSESSSFYLNDWKRYRLTPDSEMFALTRAYQAGEYGEDYAYVISPKQAAGFPEVVTVTLEKYAEYQVTLKHTDVIRSARLEDAYENSFKPVENQTDVYKVYGEGIVLKAWAIDGYSPVVEIKSTAEGAETTELTPYRINDEGGMEYYLGEIREDKIIQVKAVRSVQKKTYYKVGFLSEGGNAEVMDAVHGIPYTVNSDQENYRTDYSILKGDKVSFYVEPAFGYELRGVYANGQRVQPVSGAGSSRDIYEVTPVAETQIRIDVAEIVPKYPLTFHWTNTDAVKSVKVQGYELQNNRIEVAAGEKISFSVELTDTKYSVTSVTMNGQQVPYSAGNGCYTLTTLKEPMNVEINADVADKIIRFSNMVEKSQYEVETNGLIRFRNENTYLVSGNAELLKFKVKVPDKALEVGVTYINQNGVKEVLREKEKTDLGEQGLSYSYEIAVAQLPLNSEITIGGAIPAGDKKDLETAVAMYEGYQKSDYTEESWTAFEQALKDAQDCMKKENATQEEIDAVLGRLQSAAAALVKKGDTPVDPDDPDDPGPNAPEGLWIRAIPDVTYTGTAYKPAVKVYHGRKLLTEKKDYTVAYKNNVKAGKAVVTVNGKGNYKAKDAAEFNILKKNINDEDIVIDDVCAIIKSNGTVANPKVTVKFGKKALKANSDYKVIYPELEKDADGKIIPKTYRITISTEKARKKGSEYLDAENFTGERQIDYTVCPSGTLLMSSAKIALDRTKVDYAGVLGADTVKPQVTGVKIGNVTLAETDYTVGYENWDQIGKATVTVTAKDGTNYFGNKSVTYTVNGTKITAGNLEVKGIESRIYTGQPIYVSDNPVTGAKGTMVVKTKGANVKTLTEGADYTVSYKTGKVEGAHTNVGTVSVTITGINAYSGTVKKSFKITPFDLTGYSKAGSALTFAVEGDGKAKYTKNGARPAFTLSFNDGKAERALVEKTDFTVSYAKNAKIKNGEKSATMTIKGKGNFTGTIPYPYEVTAASESDVYAVAADIAVPDQFKKLKTTVKVIESETRKALKAGTDYDNNIMYYTDAACTTQITADNFTGLNLGVDSKVYAKVVMKTGGCYAGAAGTAPGEKVAVFRLYDKDKKISTASKFTVEVKTDQTADGTKINCDKNGNPIYTGKPIEPKVVVTPRGSTTPLTEGTDYEVDYGNTNVNKGKATVTVTAIGGGYGGSKSVKFTIVPSDMSWAETAEAATKKAIEIFSELMMQN